MTRASHSAVSEPLQRVNLLPRSSPSYYSLAVTLNKKSKTITSYRKQSLYYTDDTWALGGPDAFYDSLVGTGTLLRYTYWNVSSKKQIIAIHTC